MPYSQPNVDQYALSGYSFFRLKQALASPGDIFESTQGAHAFAVGPNSDISQVNVGYFDQQVATFLETFLVTPQHGFASDLTAFNTSKNYSPSKTPARLLIWPAEIYDSTYQPVGFGVGDRFVFEPPIIDIFQYFSPPATLETLRSDKTFYYETLPINGNNDCWVAVPFYGRRYASIVMRNSSVDMACTVSVIGVNFRISESQSNEVELVAAFTLGFGALASRVITPNYDSRIGMAPPVTNVNAGVFDYLLVKFTPAGGPAVDPVDISLRIVVSDTVTG